MQRIIKGVCFTSLCLISVVFLLMGYADISIPDEIVLTDDRSISSGAIFTYTLSENGAERKVSSENYMMNILLFDAIPIKTSKVTLSKRKYVSVSGKIIGIRMYTDGVMIVANQEIETASGSECPGGKAGLKVGDIIKKVGNRKINSSKDLSRVIEESKGKALSVTVMRNSEITAVTLNPVKCKNDGKYKAGLWVRDSTAGIGTMTFYDRETGVFAGLGHAVCDIDTGEEMPISNGDIVKSKVKGCYKSKSGSPGELCGVFDGGSLGDLYVNSQRGIYGILKNVNNDDELMPVAMPYEVKPGKARILATVQSNVPKYYDVEIVSVHKSSSDVKNMVVKVTDEELLKKTGGIVQGMSGTPIIQNGMLVGAVTHVFVNDPAKGYAIFAENMIDTAETLANSKRIKKVS